MKLHCLIQLLISALILLGLIFNIRNSRLFNFYDHLLHHKLVKNRDGKIWKVITVLNEPKVIVVWDFLLAGLLVLFHHPWLALWSLGTLAVTDAVGIFLKHSVKRKRPLSMRTYRDGYSFPSGHTLGFFLVVAILFLIVIPLIQKASVRTILQILLIFAVFFLAVSRVYLYAHWPFDTIGAMLLAYAWLQVAEWLYVAWAPR